MASSLSGRSMLSANDGGTARHSWSMLCFRACLLRGWTYCCTKRSSKSSTLPVYEPSTKIKRLDTKQYQIQYITRSGCSCIMFISLPTQWEFFWKTAFLNIAKLERVKFYYSVTNVNCKTSIPSNALLTIGCFAWVNSSLAFLGFGNLTV